jgi:putative membrane protein
VIPAPLLQFFRGFFMGAADIVPGVSGGTVALILGIYRTFVNQIRAGAHALKQLVTGDVTGGFDSLKAIDWLFLIPLGVGAASAFIALRGLMKTALEEHSELTAAAFCGLVLASCWLVWNEMSDRDPFRVAIAAGVAVAAFVLLGFQNGAVSDPNLLFFFGTGAIAICAMILPGISGSFIMLMLGMYAAVLGGSIPELLVFAVGATVGLGAFSTVLNHLLERYEQTVLAALLGLMTGSLRVLWPWPNGVGYTIEEGETETTIPGTGLDLWPDVSALAQAFALMVAAAGLTLLVVSLADRLSAEDTRQPVSV